jgi:hypothetical protein
MVIILSEETVVFAATVVPEAPDVVVNVPEPPVFKAIVVADPPSVWKVKSPELGVIEILPAVLNNVPVPPLAPSIVNPPDADVTEIALPDVALVTVPLAKSTVDADIFNVLLAAPVLNNPLVLPSPPANVSELVLCKFIVFAFVADPI